MELSEIFSEFSKEFSKHVLFETVLDRMKQIARIGGRGDSETETETIYTGSEAANLFLRHRKKVYSRLYERAFESGKDVLYVSVMSKDTLDNMRDHLERAKKTRTTLYALTWDPKVGPQAIEAFRKHLGEFEHDPSGASRQVGGAYAQWKQLKQDFPGVIIGLRSYASAPTMQGVLVKGEWALIELIPYHTTKDERPALVLSAKYDAELYAFFDKAFSNLYDHSTPI